MPMKFFGRAEAAASEVIGSVEVLEPKIASFGSTASARRITSSLTARSSNTASMTRSAPASAAKSAPA